MRRVLAMLVAAGILPVGAVAQSVIEMPLPSHIDVQQLRHEASSSGLTGEHLEHLFNELLDAARGVTGGIPPDPQLVVPFDIVADGETTQVQQHDLDFRYTPAGPWLLMKLQFLEESDGTAARAGSARRQRSRSFAAAAAERAEGGGLPPSR